MRNGTETNVDRTSVFFRRAPRFACFPRDLFVFVLFFFFCLILSKDISAGEANNNRVLMNFNLPNISPIDKSSLLNLPDTCPVAECDKTRSLSSTEKVNNTSRYADTFRKNIYIPDRENLATSPREKKLLNARSNNYGVDKLFFTIVFHVFPFRKISPLQRRLRELFSLFPSFSGGVNRRV